MQVFNNDLNTKLYEKQGDVMRAEQDKRNLQERHSHLEAQLQLLLQENKDMSIFLYLDNRS